MFWFDKIIEIPLTAEKVLFFNTLSGALDVFDKKTIEKIKNKDTRKYLMEPSLKEKLVKRAYLFESQDVKKKKEDEVIQLLQKIDNRVKYNFVIIPTYECNFGCKYCYEMDATYTSQKMTLQDINKVFSSIQYLLADCKTPPPHRLTLMGGEPLLYSNKDIIERILMSASSMGMNIVIITNGGDLNKFIPLFLKYKNNIEEIQVTLDGTQEVHDGRRPFRNGSPSFQKIIDGIKRCAERNIKISVRVNLDAKNIECVDELASFLTAQKWFKKEQVVPYFFPISNEGCLGSKYVLDEPLVLAKVLKKMENNNSLKLFGLQFHGIDALLSALKSGYIPRIRYCEGNKSQFVFDPSGNIYKCWFGIRNPESFIVGKFMPNFFVDEEKIKMWTNRTGCTISKCNKCKYVFICGGGCAEKAWEKFGKIDKPKCIDFDKILGTYAKYLWNNGFLS